MIQIPVSLPDISSIERKYVDESMKESAISGLYGKYLDLFNDSFANFIGTEFAENCSNGTNAIHLALLAIGVRKGDEVLVSSLTNMATFFAVLYCGAKPIPVDIVSETLTMCPIDLERKITPRSRAILVVHLFGQPADMNSISEVAKVHDLKIIEDVAEAHGAEYRGKKAGNLGDIAAFSFFGNKNLACGEGGSVTTNSKDLINRVKSLKSLSFGSGSNKFIHSDIGYNYRMTNLQAAIAYAQVKRANELISKRIEVCEFYTKLISDYNLEMLKVPVNREEGIKNVYWMYHLVLQSKRMNRDQLLEELKISGIETRPGFVPANLQPVFKKYGIYDTKDCPVASSLAFNTFYLPTYTTISKDLQVRVIEILSRILN